MYTRNFKKLISFILTLALILGLAPGNLYLPLDVMAAGSKTLAAQDGAGTVTVVTAPTGYAAMTGSDTSWNKNFIVNKNVSLTTVTVSGDVTVWVAEGKTLTIDGVWTGTNTSNTSWGVQGGTALTINSGSSLTFAGPGKINITGGMGQIGSNMYAFYNATIQGCWGSQGGYAIDNEGTLTFATGMSGDVTITGGRGGDGGGGGYGGALNINGGAGGHGGYGGTAIHNSGTINFDQDNLNYALGHDGTYSTGNINIKGGTGGVGGRGGTGGRAYYTITRYASQPATAGSDTDSWTSYPTIGGSSMGGAAGIGIVGGNIHFNRGVATIEGGRCTGGIAGAAGYTSPTCCGRTGICRSGSRIRQGLPDEHDRR